MSKNYCSVLGDSTIINLFFNVHVYVINYLFVFGSDDVKKPQFLRCTYIVPFFVYFFNVSFYGIPSIYYVCNFLPCPIFTPRSYRRGKLCFQNNFSLLQQYNFFSICTIWLPLRHFLFSTITNSNIQTHPTLNVYPHKVIKACIIYLLKN